MAILVIDEDSGIVRHASVLKLGPGIALDPTLYLPTAHESNPQAFMRIPNFGGETWDSHIRFGLGAHPHPVQVLTTCHIDTDSTWPEGTEELSQYPGDT